MEDEKQNKLSKEKVKSNFENTVFAWCLDYLGNETRANELTGIIMYHSRREFKARLRMGFVIGIIFIFILLKWLS